MRERTPSNSPNRKASVGTRRIAKILAGNSIFNTAINASVIAQTRHLQRKGHGETTFPHNLDLLRISAPKPDACLWPRYITLECVHGTQQDVPIRCGKCEGCKMHWRKKVRAMVKEGCRGHASWFWTLTLEEYPDEMDKNRFDYIQERWHKLLRECDRHGIRFHYLKVVELQKRGTPHFHLVINRVTRNGQKLNSTALIKYMLGAMACKAGFGVQMELEAVKYGGGGAASYLSKYLSKQDLFEMTREDGRAIRRYSKSQGWCYFEKGALYRYRKVGEIHNERNNDKPNVCGCADGFTILPHLQAFRWVERCIAADSWVAPMGLFDNLHTLFERG